MYIKICLFICMFVCSQVYILFELLSPLLCPFVLLSLRSRSLDIVDFYRNFTVSVLGIGDVCSFAQVFYFLITFNFFVFLFYFYYYDHFNNTKIVYIFSAITSASLSISFFHQLFQLLPDIIV